jgi:hypothetical protein
VLPAGDHDVVFRFRSQAILGGAAISVAALAAMFLARRRLRIAARPVEERG